MSAPFGPLICRSTSIMAMDLVSPTDRGVLTAIPEVRSWARSGPGSSAATPSAMAIMVGAVFWANICDSKLAGNLIAIEIIRLALLLGEPARRLHSGSAARRQTLAGILELLKRRALLLIDAAFYRSHSTANHLQFRIASFTCPEGQCLICTSRSVFVVASSRFRRLK